MSGNVHDLRAPNRMNPAAGGGLVEARLDGRIELARVAGQGSWRLGMSTLAVETAARARDVQVTRDELIVDLRDGRTVSVPLARFPKLLHANHSDAWRGVFMRKTKSGTHYVFKISLAGSKRIWRKIALRGDQTLDDLHEAIFHAFDRYDEHLYSFYFPKPGARGRDRLRDAAEYGHPYSVEEPNPYADAALKNAATASLDSLKLKVGQRFEYLFDFGDSWWHEVTVEQIEGAGGGSYPRVIESRGDSPPQYPEVE